MSPMISLRSERHLQPLAPSGSIRPSQMGWTGTHCKLSSNSNPAGQTQFPVKSSLTYSGRHSQSMVPGICFREKNNYYFFTLELWPWIRYQWFINFLWVFLLITSLSIKLYPKLIFANLSISIYSIWQRSRISKISVLAVLYQLKPLISHFRHLSNSVWPIQYEK